MTDDEVTDEELATRHQILDDWMRRLDVAVTANVKKRTAKNRTRAEMAERRAYGLKSRHAEKLRRIRGGDTTKEYPMKTTCRYLRRGTAGQCTAEAVDPDGEVLICQHHLANALELLKASGFTITPPKENQ